MDRFFRDQANCAAVAKLLKFLLTNAAARKSCLKRGCKVNRHWMHTVMADHHSFAGKRFLQLGSQPFVGIGVHLQCILS